MTRTISKNVTLCRRSGLNPSSSVTVIFLFEQFWVSLICMEMIVVQLSVKGFWGFSPPIWGSKLPDLKFVYWNFIWNNYLVIIPPKSALYTCSVVYYDHCLSTFSEITTIRKGVNSHVIDCSASNWEINSQMIELCTETLFEAII